MWKVGDKLGRFQLEKEIGQGSHGVVFSAKDTALDTAVAVKILHPWLTQDTAVRDRFKRELLLARRISHPGVCRLFDLHEEGEAFFITMEFVEGQTLLNILKVEGKLKPARAVKIMRGVCQALAAAHQAGVIHRDLKPANIIVRAGDLPMILDFGTATAGDVSRVTRPGTAVGSMRFIAPEVFTGVSPSTKTDIYSLGVVAYVTLAGKLPYNAAAGAIEMLDMIKNQPPQRLDVAQPEVPRILADVVGRAMEKDPDQRFQTIVEFEQALGEVERVLEGGQQSDSATWAPPSVVKSALQAAKTGPQAPVTLPNPVPVPSNLRADSSLEPRDTLSTASPFLAPATNPPRHDTAEVPAHRDPHQERTRISPFQAGMHAPSGEKPPPSTAVTERPNLTLGSMMEPEGSGDVPLVTGSLEPQPETPATADHVMPVHATAGHSTAGQAMHEVTQATFNPLTDPRALSASSNPDSAPPTPSVIVDQTQVSHEPREVTLRVARVDATMIVDPADLVPPASSRGKIAAAVGAVIGVVVLVLVMLVGDSGTGPARSDGGPLAFLPPNTIDAGPAAAGDAGAAIAAMDAGTVALTDPAADAGIDDEMNFGDGEGEPAEDPIAPKGPRVSPQVMEAIRGAKAKMNAKGFIPGDVPTADASLLKAWGARMRTGESIGHAREALRGYDGQEVDRAFVLKKLQRFNANYANAKQRNPKIADRVEPLSRAAAEAFGRGQFPQANKKLNGAFAAVRR